MALRKRRIVPLFEQAIIITKIKIITIMIMKIIFQMIYSNL